LPVPLYDPFNQVCIQTLKIVASMRLRCEGLHPCAITGSGCRRSKSSDAHREREPCHALVQHNDGRRLFFAERTIMNTSISTSFLCLLLASLISSPASAAVSRNEYDALIRDARAGNYEPALIMLRQHGMEHPKDLRAAYDHILIASWAGNNDETVTAYEAMQPRPNRPPADVLAAVARAYRDTQRWDYALDHYREGRRLFPREPSFAVGEIMTLADAGRADEAIARGKELVEKLPEDADARIALAYAYKERSSPYPVFQEADQARSLAPGKTYVTTEYINALRHAGLAEAALRVAKEHPGLVDEATMRGLEADYLAEVT